MALLLMPAALAASGAEADDTARFYSQSEIENTREFYIVSTDGMCAAIIVLVVIYILINARMLSVTAHSFLGICVSALIRFASDAAQTAADGGAGAAAMAVNRTAAFLMYVSWPLIGLATSMFFYNYINERAKCGKAVLYVGWTYMAAALLAIMASQFNGMLYTINDMNRYSRGCASLYYFIFSGACVAAIGVWLISKRKLLNGKELAALLTALALPLVGAVAQLLQPNVSPANAFTTVGFCAAFLSLQSIIFKSERLGRISTQSEIEGIGEIFTGVYRWNRVKKCMEGSVTGEEYAPLLNAGTLNIERFLSDAVYPADRDKVKSFLDRDKLDALIDAPEKLLREIEYREIGAYEGEWRRISLIHLEPKPGEENQLYMVFQDVTYERNLAEHSAAQRRRLIGAAAGLYDDICEWNMDNDTALRLTILPEGVRERPLGVSWSENMERFRREAVMPEDLELFDVIAPEQIKSRPAGDVVNSTFRVLTDGEYHWNSATIKIFQDTDGTRTAMYMQQDIDASIREHNALRDRSEHDALTDLFNRTKLDDMRRAEYRGLETCGVMFFDINNLKKTNDTLGHEAGDELICLAAESVRSITNRRIMAYRYGGDELLVVAANVTREEFEQSMRLWGIRLESLNKTARNKCSMALGSVWDESGEDIDELIKRADALMYENKKLMKTGRGE